MASTSNPSERLTGNFVITFHEARQIAAATLSARFGYEVPIEPWGFEDAEAFLVLEHHEPDLVPMGAPAVFVSKADGALTLVPHLSGRERIKAMRSVGVPEWVALSATGPYVRAGVHLSPEEFAAAGWVPDGAEA